MAENIQDPNFADNLTSLENDSVLIPSTPEAQQATISALDASAQKDKKRGMQAILTGTEQTPEIEEANAIAAHRQEKEKQERLSIQQQEQNSALAAENQKLIEELQANIDYAKQNGLSSVALETKLKTLEAAKSKLIGGQGMEPLPTELVKNTPEQLDQPQALEQGTQEEVPNYNQEPSRNVSTKVNYNSTSIQPSISKVTELANQINTEKTIQAAQDLSLQDEIEAQKEVLKKAQTKLDSEDLSLKSIDNDRFWNSKTTWQKVVMGIGMFLGAAGSSPRNLGVAAIERAIEKDIESQKLDNANILAKRQDAFKRVSMEISRLSDLSNNQDKKDRLALAQQMADAKQNEIAQERFEKAKAMQYKDFILRNNIKLENLSATQIAQIFKPEDFKAAQILRTEYNSETRNMGTAKVVASYNRILESVSNPSAAGDVAMIFNYMKMLDPGSVVRESEYRTAAEAGALPDRLMQKYYDGLKSGRTLSPTQRADFKNRSAKMLSGQLKAQRMINLRYSKLSSNQGIPSSLVVDDYNLEAISPREALWQKKSAENPNLSRKNFDKSVDKKIEQNPAFKKFE